MFKKLMKNKKAQQTAEYALLIALVVAAIIAMQTYAQRTLQAKIRDAGHYLTSQTSQMGNTLLYEPNYLDNDYLVSRNNVENVRLGQGISGMDGVTNRTRASGGFQSNYYNGDTGD